MKTYFLLFFLIIGQIVFSQGVFIDHRHTDLSQIPDEWITAAKANLKIRYFRRSHGSQIDKGGMDALRRYSPAYMTKYNYGTTGAADELFLSVPANSTVWVSLDYENATWVAITKAYLDDPANAQINVVMWAWSSFFYACSATKYVNDMEALISEYGPGGSKIISGVRTVPVTFVFQTACGQRTAERNALVFAKNDTIRTHCVNHNRVLFDFNDIECHNPNGDYFGDGDVNGNYTNVRRLNDDLAYTSSSPGGSVYADCRNWGIDWMASNPTSELTKLAADNICTSCAHSEGTAEGETKDNSRLHCVLKGRAVWYLWATLAGWSSGNTTAIQVNNKVETTELKNYPNPFTNNTLIEYSLKENSRVKLEIWNSSGQLIKVLVNQNQSVGNYQVPAEIESSNGIFYYTLEVNGNRTSKKMIKMK